MALDKTPEEGSYAEADGYVTFTRKFKYQYLGSCLTQDLYDNTDIAA